MNKPQDISSLFDSIKDSFTIIKQCPICSFAYDHDIIRIVEQKTHASLIHITCPKCNTAMIALIGSTHIGIGMVGLITDLSKKDVIRLKHKPAITDDELLDYYQTIKLQSKKLLQIITH